MIKYKLKCKSRFCINEKEFDGWFQSIEAYENQKLQNLVNCPVCGSDNVVKFFGNFLYTFNLLTSNFRVIKLSLNG